MDILNNKRVIIYFLALIAIFITGFLCMYYFEKQEEKLMGFSDSYSEINKIKILGNNYYLRNYTVYNDKNGDKVVSDADIESFSIIGKRGGFAKDKNNVYFYGNKIEGSDPQSFEVLDEKYGYGKDKNFAYYKDRKINESDVDTYNIVDSYRGYSKDAKNVYFLENIIKDANPKTFEMSSTLGYARDDDDYYYRGEKIKKERYMFDAESILPKSAKKLGGHYVEYDYAIYYYEPPGQAPGSYSEVEILDRMPNTEYYFKVLGDNYANNSNEIFYKNGVLNDADYETFKIISGSYAKDRNNVYCGSEIINGADVESFKIINLKNELTEDKYSKYQYCKKID